jgi:hypothetical protein
MNDLGKGRGSSMVINSPCKYQVRRSDVANPNTVCSSVLSPLDFTMTRALPALTLDSVSSSTAPVDVGLSLVDLGIWSYVSKGDKNNQIR